MTIGASHNHTCDCTEVEVTWKIEKESCFKNQVEKNDIYIQYWRDRSFYRRMTNFPAENI